MTQPLKDQGSPQSWIFFILIAGLVGITALFMISRIFQYSGPKLLNSPYSVDTSLRRIQIGSAEFVVPENTIRRPEHRDKSQVKMLDLILLWPELKGFSLEDQIAFSDVSELSRIIFVSLSQQTEAIASSDRLYSIYSQHFVGDPIEGPSSLIGFAMAKDSGFAGEVIYFKPDESEPFVARCITPVEQTPTFCIRDIALQNNVQLTYRFRLKLLEEWDALDRNIRSAMEAFQRR